MDGQRRLGTDGPGQRPSLYKSLSYDSVNDFTMISMTTRFPFAIAVGANSPIQSLEQLLKAARERYDFVVLDTPPVLPVFDASLLSRWVDGMLIVVAANQTPRKLLAEALNLLDPSKVLGIVFNSDNRPMFGYYHGYYKQYFPRTAGVVEA